MSRNIYLGVMLLCCSLLAGYTGYGVSGPATLDMVDPELLLLSPVGGEAWFGGSTQNILWAASDAYMDPNSVCLWYSVDGGASFVEIAENAPNDGIEPWTLPWVNTTNAQIKVRVEDIFGNATEQVPQSCFSIIEDSPLEPQDVLASVSGVDIQITWQAVSNTVNGYPFIPDGYIVLHSTDPHASGQDYQYLGMTTNLSFTHQGAVSEHSRHFYRVIAFKSIGRAEYIYPFGLMNMTEIQDEVPYDPHTEGGER
jgi:hypothetical protein